MLREYAEVVLKETFGTHAAYSILGIWGAILTTSVVLLIIGIVVGWRIFQKAGEPGWKILIPVYNQYIFFKIAWKPGMFWVMFLLTTVSGALNVCLALMGSFEAAVGILLFDFLAALIGLVIGVMFWHKLAKAFGRGVGFTIGLLLLNFIFLMILAFGSSQYVGADRR